MILSTGTKLSHYEISSQIGKGGMGEVYQATDTKLGRDVAIKVLPEEFARDADRVARFQREAKLLASLNHPNIAAIYGLEEADGIHFLVLELVEGQTLAERIKGGPLPVEEALKLALQIAEALEAAHEKGVIHRDLKPANIKVTPDGKVKVLDFGLAKAYAGEQEQMNLSNSPTLSDMATQQGLILGTAAYMSPEQARGKPVDNRTDVWAFGCVLYEMLTGKAAFQGEDVTEILAAVVKSGVNMDLLPANIHPRISEVLSRCLQKDQQKRYAGIGDVQYEIERVLADPSGVFAQPVATVEPQRKLQTIFPWIAVTAILCLIIAGVAVWVLKPSEPRQAIRFDYNLPDDQQFNSTVMPIAVSPNGRQIAFDSAGGLYLRSVEQWAARPLVGPEEDTRAPFFSPDGKWIGYWSAADRKLKKISVNGGTPSPLCDTQAITGAKWYTDKTIIFSSLTDGIMRVSENGGNPETLISTESLPDTPFFPQLLPDGKSLLFTMGHDLSPEGSQTVAVLSLESGDMKKLFNGKAAQYLPTGHLIYRVGNSLFAVPFDLDTMEEVGGGISVIEDVRAFTASASGNLIYIPGTASTTLAVAERTLVWVDRFGKEDPLPFMPDAYAFPRISSPDGTKVSLVIGGALNTNIWVLDLVRQTKTKLTSDETTDLLPLWTLDGKRIVFLSFSEGKAGVYWRAADGTGEAELLASVPDSTITPSSWSADGKTLVLDGFSSDMPVTVLIPLVASALTSSSISLGRSPGAKSDIALLPLDGDRELKSLLADKYYESDPQISPDGRWIAYVSDESAQNDVYVRPYPDVNGGKWTISTSGGINPKWSPDGKELFYISGGWMMSVPIESGTAFTAGQPQRLFKFNYYAPMGIGYDVHPNGKKFLIIKQTARTDDESKEAIPEKINIVTNWFEELKEKVPVP